MGEILMSEGAEVDSARYHIGDGSEQEGFRCSPRAVHSFFSSSSNFQDGCPSQRRPPSPRWRRPLVARKQLIVDMRATELIEVATGEDEDGIPELPFGDKGLTSEAHLRSDEFWAELLGEDVTNKGPCRWLDTGWFEVVSVIFIIVGARLLGLQGDDFEPGWPFWGLQAVLAFALLELWARVTRIRAGIPLTGREASVCFLFDSVAVSARAMEQIILPILGAIDIGLAESNVANLRTFTRMLWLLRFVRLLRVFRGMHEVAMGIVDAMQGLAWVLVFEFLMLYILAVLCTRLIGHKELLIALGHSTVTSKAGDEVVEKFASVGASMYILFQTMTAHPLWVLDPLFHVLPFLKVFFSMFFIFAAWVMLAVMTGTVSFNMCCVIARDPLSDEAWERARHAQARTVLLDIFERLDADGSGELDQEEFQAMLQSKEIVSILQKETDIKLGDLEDLWNWLDDDGSGSVSIDEFMSLFEWLNSPFKPRTIVRMEEKIRRDHRQLRERLQDLVDSHLGAVMQELTSPLKKLNAVAEQVHILGSTFRSFRLNQAGVRSCTIQAMETRLGEQIDVAFSRVAKYVPSRKANPVM